ncbi:MAG: hypothetical protein KAS07_04270 [Candidatus Pacebacteria bacterium]|nr:hypothetical protein [Candidatus Paceibacterota bacterium]
MEHEEKINTEKTREILFICYGNVHRSVLAEHIANKVLSVDDQYFAISRGIQGMNGYEKPKHSNLMQYEIQWKLTKKALDEIGVDTSFFKGKVSTYVTKSQIENAFRIIAMDKKTAEILKKEFPESENKIRLFESWIGGVDVSDCAESNDAEKHLRVNTSIVSNIRESLLSILKKEEN